MLTEQELELRRTKIGSSDAASILEISPWKTRYELWEDKIFGKTGVTNSAMARGNDLEPLALQQFEKDTGIAMMKPAEPFFNKQRAWQMATLDGISFEGESIVEIKCPNREVHQMALEKKLPRYYYAQVQHQLAVVNLEMAFYYSYDGVNGAVVEVKRDPAFLDNLLEEEEKFFSLMQTQEPPELSDRDYPIIEDEFMFDFRQRWEEILKNLKHWETAAEKLKNEAKAHVGYKSARGYGIKLSKTITPGRIKYKEIPELQSVNLDAYRGSPVESWRIFIEKSK